MDDTLGMVAFISRHIACHISSCMCRAWLRPSLCIGICTWYVRDTWECLPTSESIPSQGYMFLASEFRMAEYARLYTLQIYSSKWWIFSSTIIVGTLFRFFFIFLSFKNVSRFDKWRPLARHKFEIWIGTTCFLKTTRYHKNCNSTILQCLVQKTVTCHTKSDSARPRWQKGVREALTT